MALSSTGIGSGLDVESIIKQLTALEKRPLTLLKSRAADIQTKLSTVGTIKSQISALSDAAFKLSLDGSWNGVAVSSSKASAVSGTVTGVAAATSFGVEVSQLAKAQSTASSAVTTGTAMGTGTLTIDLGTWNYGVVPPTFPASPTSTVSVTILAGEDGLSAIAAKINDANAGVTATVLKDASGERLLMRSKETGEATGFRIKVTDDSDGNNINNDGLSRLAFDPGTLPAAGMAANTYQKGLNTLASVNGVPVTSSKNTLADAIPGLTLQFSEVTTGPVEITLSNDLPVVRKNILDFVAAYNAVNKTLSDATKYDAETKTAGVLQGDSTAVGLQNALRNLLGSTSVGSTLSRLADAGVGLQFGGVLNVTGSKLDTAMKDMDNLKKLFTADNGNAQTNGFALKVKDFARGLLAFDGLVTNKTTALDAAVTRNSKEQDRVNDRIGLVEKRLRKQYSSLDARMGSLTALNAYVSQQVTQWNK
jgi:flagellar hook-associated protein 2